MGVVVADIDAIRDHDYRRWGQATLYEGTVPLSPAEQHRHTLLAEIDRLQDKVAMGEAVVETMIDSNTAREKCVEECERLREVLREIAEMYEKWIVLNRKANEGYGGFGYREARQNEEAYASHVLRKLTAARDCLAQIKGKT